MQDARRRLTDATSGPRTPRHDFGDLYYFHTYIERRAVVSALLGYVVLLVAAALLSALVWGAPQRLVVGLAAIGYWPAVWQLYLRRHYRPELRAERAKPE